MVLLYLYSKPASISSIILSMHANSLTAMTSTCSCNRQFALADNIYMYMYIYIYIFDTCTFQVMPPFSTPLPSKSLCQPEIQIVRVRGLHRSDKMQFIQQCFKATVMRRYAKHERSMKEAIFSHNKRQIITNLHKYITNTCLHVPATPPRGH